MKRALLLVTLLGCGSESQEQICTECTVDMCGFQNDLNEDEHFLRFENGDTAALIVREWVDQGSGRSAIYELRGFALLRDGKLDCFSQGLEYENSHHNWSDRARVNVDGGKIELRLDYERTWNWRFVLDGPDFDEVSLSIVEGTP